MKKKLSMLMGLVLGSLLLVGCSTRDTEITSAGIKCADVSGIWEITEEINLSACRVPDETKTYNVEFIQNGCNVTVKDTEVTGVMRGDHIYWAPFRFPGDEGGTVTVNSSVHQVPGKGKSSWRWTDGSESCTGVTVITTLRK